MVDSLGVSELLYSLDQSVSLLEIRTILEGSSNEARQSLERIVDSLAKYFKVPGYTNTSIGGFTKEDQVARESLHANIGKIDALYIDQESNLKLTTGAISLVGVTDSTNRIYFGDEIANVSVVGIDRGKRERIYFSA